jgi:hypothetical protein
MKRSRLLHAALFGMLAATAGCGQPQPTVPGMAITSETPQVENSSQYDVQQRRRGWDRRWTDRWDRRWTGRWNRRWTDRWDRRRYTDRWDRRRYTDRWDRRRW